MSLEQHSLAPEQKLKIMFVSYAQNFEDVLLWRALKDVTHGFYIDVGAWDPDIDSVTRAFSDAGWRGINIEPLPEFHCRLVQQRPNDVNLLIAAGEAPKQAQFYNVEGTGLSTTDLLQAQVHAASGFTIKSATVEVSTLAEICRLHAPSQIHFLKVDCEGDERATLLGADFDQFRPWIILVEATIPLTQEPRHQEWEQLLLDAAYRFVWFDGLNRFYIAAEHYDHLAPLLAQPPNVFDNFMRARELSTTVASISNQNTSRSTKEMAENSLIGVFETLLFRQIDAESLNYMVSQLIEERLNYSQLLKAVLSSPEFRLKRERFLNTYFSYS